MGKERQYLFEISLDGGLIFDKQVSASSRRDAFNKILDEYPTVHKISLLEE